MLEEKNYKDTLNLPETTFAPARQLRDYTSAVNEAAVSNVGCGD